MKIKSNVEFISFGDGVCNIYFEDEEDNKTHKYKNLGFSERILGFKRYFTAAANQVNVKKVVRIPQVPNIDIHDTVEIEGLGRFCIELVQPINDTNPRCIDLTLSQIEMRR